MAPSLFAVPTSSAQNLAPEQERLKFLVAGSPIVLTDFMRKAASLRDRFDFEQCAPNADELIAKKDTVRGIAIFLGITHDEDGFHFDDTTATFARNCLMNNVIGDKVTVVMCQTSHTARAFHVFRSELNACAPRRARRTVDGLSAYLGRFRT